MNTEQQHIEDIETEVNQEFFARVCGAISYVFVCVCCSLCGKESE